MAAVIFDGWFAEKTVQARYFVNEVSPLWFKNFYIDKGEAIAVFIKNKPVLKAILRPLFEIFAWIGKKEGGL